VEIASDLQKLLRYFAFAFAPVKHIWSSGGDQRGKSLLHSLVSDQRHSGIMSVTEGLRSTMPKRSAGLLMYRGMGDEVEVFLVHPGGPLWAKKDKGAWTIPKGEYEKDENPLAAARREFQEETGFQAAGEFFELGWVKQKSGKIVTGWAFEGDCDPERLISNTCEIEWPPRSGRRLEIPEVDRGRWFSVDEARKYIRAEQEELLDRLKDGLEVR
jgi:predicted NUDIX family NTP pyrophosphohydrolase